MMLLANSGTPYLPPTLLRLSPLHDIADPRESWHWFLERSFHHRNHRSRCRSWHLHHWSGIGSGLSSPTRVHAKLERLRHLSKHLLSKTKLLCKGWVVNVQPRCAKTFARYRGHLGPSGRKLQIEFENGFPGPFGPGPKKSKTESNMSQNSWKIIDFDSFSNTPSHLANFTGRGCGGVSSFDSTPIHSQQYSCIKSVNQNKFCNYARRTEKNCRFLFHEAQKRDSQNRETPESLRGKKQQKHVCLVAFQTQTQNRSVLATLLPKLQQLRNFPNRNPAPGVSSKTQFQIANRS